MITFYGGRNASPKMNLYHSSVGQLINNLSHDNKSNFRKIEKLNKSLVNKQYGILFNETCIYIDIYIHVYICIYNYGLLENLTNCFNCEEISIINHTNHSVVLFGLLLCVCGACCRRACLAVTHWSLLRALKTCA